MEKMNRRIRVSYGETINTGNYESKRIDVSLETDVPDSDDIDITYDEVYTQVSNTCKRLINR